MLDPEASSPVRDVCSVIIYRDGKYLLVQENKPAVHGLWNFPGGHSDQLETLEEAAIREASEEVGYDVRVLKKLLVVERPADNRRLNAFFAEIIGGELQLQTEEILDAKWFSHDEILAMRDKLRDAEYVISAIGKTGSV